MNRQPSPSVAQRNEDLLARIRVLKAEHPFWGYRRIWAYLHVVEQLPVKRSWATMLGCIVRPSIGSWPWIGPSIASSRQAFAARACR